MLRVLTLIVGGLKTNCYIVYDPSDKRAVVVDPGDDAEYISDTLQKHGLIPLCVLATHGHFDHILAAFALTQAYGIPFYIHAADEFLVTRMRDTAKHFLHLADTDPAPVVSGTLADGQRIQIGTGSVTVLATPGHTPGSVCLVVDGADTVITGDTVFADGGVGRTDHAYGKPLELRDSVARIMRLAPKTQLLSGHGHPTTVAAERRFHVQ